MATQHYERKPEHDRRIARGDDFAGNAYLDTTTGEIIWVAVGVDPNRVWGVANDGWQVSNDCNERHHAVS